MQFVFLTKCYIRPSHATYLPGTEFPANCIVNTYQHILATIPYYDGSSGDVIAWLERIEAACLYAKRDPRQEALGHSGGKLLDSILSVPSNQPWKILQETLMRDWAGRKMEPYGSKRIWFSKRSERLETKTGLKPRIQASANQRPSRH